MDTGSTVRRTRRFFLDMNVRPSPKSTASTTERYLQCFPNDVSKTVFLGTFQLKLKQRCIVLCHKTIHSYPTVLYWEGRLSHTMYCVILRIFCYFFILNKYEQSDVTRFYPSYDRSHDRLSVAYDVTFSLALRLAIVCLNPLTTIVFSCFMVK